MQHRVLCNRRMMAMANESLIQMKGVRDGLLVTVGDGDWPTVQTALLAYISEKSGFFKGARLTLEVGNRILRAAEMGYLRDVLSDQGVVLWAVLSSSPVTEQTAQTLGLATRMNTPRPERVVRAVENALEGENAVLVQRTIRSGFRVVSKGHVVVVGDVNPGGEVSAGGCVVVWGRARGTLIAGADGNEQAIVCALELMPTQLRIADMVVTLPQRKGKLQPEMVRLQNGRVILEAWNFKEK